MKIYNTIKVKKESNGYSIYLDDIYLMTTESEETVGEVMSQILNALVVSKDAEIRRLRKALEEVYHWSMKPTTYPQTEVDFPWAEWQVKAEQALESEEFNE